MNPNLSLDVQWWMCVCICVVCFTVCESVGVGRGWKTTSLFFHRDQSPFSQGPAACLVTSWPFANLYYPPKLLTGCHFNPNISLKFLKKDSIFFSKVHAVHIFIYIISILLEKCITKSCVWFLFYIKKKCYFNQFPKKFLDFQLMGNKHTIYKHT